MKLIMIYYLNKFSWYYVEDLYFLLFGLETIFMVLQQGCFVHYFGTC